MCIEICLCGKESSAGVTESLQKETKLNIKKKGTRKVHYISAYLRIAYHTNLYYSSFLIPVIESPYSVTTGTIESNTPNLSSG